MRINRYLLFLFLFDVGQGGALLRPTSKTPLLVPGFPHTLAVALGWGFTSAALLSLVAFVLWAHWMERLVPLRVIRWTRIGSQGLSLMVTAAWCGVGVVEVLFLHTNLSTTFAAACIVFIEAREIRWPDLTPGVERRVWQLLSGREK